MCEYICARVCYVCGGFPRSHVGSRNQARLGSSERAVSSPKLSVSGPTGESLNHSDLIARQ